MHEGNTSINFPDLHGIMSGQPVAATLAETVVEYGHYYATLNGSWELKPLDSNSSSGVHLS